MQDMPSDTIHTTFMIDGGAGRLVTAIPALEKYAIKNPNDDFRVLTAAWEEIYWAHPLLQNRTFNVHAKGVFDLHIKSRKLVVPEPYQHYEYYSNNKHLIEVFDKIINNTDKHEDLDKPNIYITSNENLAAQKIFTELRQKNNKKNVIVFQPYGSGMKSENGDKPFDPSFRSLDPDFALQLIYNLSKDNTIIYFGNKEFYHPGDNFSVQFFDNNPNIRMYMSLIANCDYFLGIDSLGQHIARAFNKKGMVILGSTLEENISYPNHFSTYRNAYVPEYVPIRISNIDSEFANNLNEKTMQFSQEDLEKIVETVNNEI